MTTEPTMARMICVWMTAGCRGGVPLRLGRIPSIAPSTAASGRRIIARRTSVIVPRESAVSLAACGGNAVGSAGGWARTGGPAISISQRTNGSVRAKRNVIAAGPALP